MAHPHLGFGTCYFRGKIGDFVYKRYGDKLVVTKVPQFKGWSERQTTGRKAFAAASAYAVKVERDQKLRASYALWAKKMDLTIRSAAMSDFLTAPALSAILPWYTGAPGSSLCVIGKQKYKLVGLMVTIRDPAGRVLEEGAARCLGPEHWSYKAVHDLRGRGLVIIEAVGTDRLGRKASLIVEKVLE